MVGELGGLGWGGGCEGLVGEDDGWGLLVVDSVEGDWGECTL